MSDIVALLLLCAATVIGTFGIGILPLFFKLSKRGLRMLEFYGAGLLVGAAMTVVIPEGVASIFASGGSGGHRHRRQVEHGAARAKPLLSAQDLVGLCLLSGFMLMFVVDQHLNAREAQRIAETQRGRESLPQTQPRRRSMQEPLPPEAVPLQDEQATAAPGRYASAEPPQGWSERSSHASSIREALSHHRLIPSSGAIRDASLLGLLIHAAADGIAMGASIRSSTSSLRLVVTLAILMHKAPTSIGLCALLMARKMSRAEIRAAVLIFSLSTPLSALATYYAIVLFVGPPGAPGSGDGALSGRDIGAALTFSGGTFLFVSMHAMLELASHAHGEDESDAGYPHAHHHFVRPEDNTETTAHGCAASLPPRWSNTLVALGAITPKALQWLMGGDVH